MCFTCESLIKQFFFWCVISFDLCGNGGVRSLSERSVCLFVCGFLLLLIIVSCDNVKCLDFFFFKIVEDVIVVVKSYYPIYYGQIDLDLTWLSIRFRFFNFSFQLSFFWDLFFSGCNKFSLFYFVVVVGFIYLFSPQLFIGFVCCGWVGFFLIYVLGRKPL